MNVLREVFNGIEQERNYKAASQLRVSWLPKQKAASRSLLTKRRSIWKFMLNDRMIRLNEKGSLD
jgi:hypothetical protein